MTKTTLKRHAGRADETARRERAIQSRIDQRKPKSRRGKMPMQAGMRKYPASFPQQHQAKPGYENKLNPAPMYDAPGYKGSEKLSGMVAIITGGDSGIGRAVAVLYAREGADIVIVYL